MIIIENKTAKELRCHLLKELALFEEIEKRFEKKYKISSTQLEERIKIEGVSPKKTRNMGRLHRMAKRHRGSCKTQSHTCGNSHKMNHPTLLETARKLLLSPLALDIQFLGTRVRAHLPKGYLRHLLQRHPPKIQLHHHKTKQTHHWIGQRPHKQVKTHPHHFHTSEGDIHPRQVAVCSR